MSLVGTRPPTVDEWEQYELHHRSRLEAVHSTWKTCPGTGKKFSVLHKISGSDESVRCDIVDDRMERLDETSNSSFNYKPSKSILAFLASL